MISVIIPCYNVEKFLHRSIGSLIGQTYQNWEAIAVNDGSNDGTLDWLHSQKDPRIKVLSQKNHGVSAARNLGLAHASGQYVAFLDADDTWEPDALERLLAVLRAEPDAALVYCGWQHLGLPGRRGLPFVPPDYEGAGKLEALLRDCCWPIHAALTRRDAIEEVGSFDTRYPTSEDFLFWLRIGSRHPIVRLPAVLACYHHHSGERATADMVRLARNHWKVQRTFLAEHPEIAMRLGRNKVRELTNGMLLKKGYVCYWGRQLESARAIFRTVMMTGYGRPRDWKYMLPSFLPLPLHRLLLGLSWRGEHNASADGRSERKVP